MGNREIEHAWILLLANQNSIASLTGVQVKKILIVEDNKDSSEILSQFITKFGHQAIKAKNSKEALALAEAETPDLIFHGHGPAGCRWSQDN